jgi:hypothetical protein
MFGPVVPVEFKLGSDEDIVTIALALYAQTQLEGHEAMQARANTLAEEISQGKLYLTDF